MAGSVVYWNRGFHYHLEIYRENYKGGESLMKKILSMVTVLALLCVSVKRNGA